MFIAESPVRLAELSKALEVPEAKIKSVIKTLEKEYIEQNRGFVLRKVGNGFRLYSNPSLSDILKNFVKSNIRAHLTQAALETLAIIAYKQPITRTQVAEIRGVRTDSVILTLEDKGLIKEAGKLKEPGNPLIYKTTDRLLELIGISSLKDLPALVNCDKNNDKEMQNE
ncbi:unnamed protein product [marine sediment metagenome]|uniref:Segregation and condensation protein B n=1 Tax=marine sediment metagenome TaxID=412755 RepID=X1MNN8_9ZZZZ